MISQKHTINNVEYIVRARTKTELDKAVKFLYDCSEYEMAQLEEELNVDLDKLLVSRLGEPTEEIQSEPAIEKPVVKPAPKTPRAKTPTAQKKDSKTVDLGRIGKAK